MISAYGIVKKILAPAVICLATMAMSRVCFAAPLGFTDTGQSFGTTSVFGLAAGDIDSDGDLDIIVGQMNGLATLVLKNNGAGVFSDTGQALGASNSRRLYLADTDNDGDLDIYQAHTAGLIVWKNDGNGNFSNSGATFAAGHSVAFFPADLDADGDMDGVSALFGGMNKVYLNNGSGSFTDSGVSLSNGLNSHSMYLLDVDADGDPDAIEGTWSGNDRIWMNNGSGSFTDSGQNLGTLQTMMELPYDMNADGYPDVVLGNSSAQADKVWMNNGSGVFSDSGQSLGTTDSYAIVLGDFDGNGTPDIYQANFSSQADTIQLNNGAGVFSDSGLSIGNLSAYNAIAADIDGDGDLDIIQGNVEAGGYIKIYRNDSNNPNAAPTAPSLTAPDVSTLAPTTQVTFQWAAGSDADTADADFLTYDVRIGTTSGGCEVFCGTFPKASAARANGPGNAGGALFVKKTLALGTYYWSARTVDATYKRSAWAAEDSLVVDNTSPTAGVVTPAISDGASVAASFGMSTAFSVIVSPVASCEYCKSTDGTCDTEWAAGTWAAGTCSAAGLTCTNGQTVTMNMRATDQLGRVGTGTAVSRTCDDSVPAAGTVTPSNSDTGVFVDPTFDLSTTFSDGTGSGVASCEYCKSTDGTCDTEWAAGTWAAGTCSASNITCTNGQSLTLSMRATDNVSQVGTGTAVSRTCDGSGPAAGAITPANTDTGTVVDQTFDLSATFSDGTGSGVASCEYCKSTDGTCDTEWTTANYAAGTCSVTNLSCTNGQSLTLNMRATDNLSLVGTGTAASRACDNTGPTAGTVTPANTDTGVFVDRTFDLSTTFNDGTGSGVASCEYCKSTDGTCDTEWTAGTWAAGTCSATNLTCTNGQSLTLNMRATDNLNFVGTASAITRYCSTPTPGAVTPSNNDSGTSVDGTFDITTIFADDAGITSCEYCKATDGTCDTEWAAGTWSAGAGNCSATGLTCTDGQNLTLNMRATNFASDVGTALAVTRACDTTAPVISGANPTAGSVFNTTSPTVTVSTNENANCRWSAADQAYANMTGNCTGGGTASHSCSPGTLPQGSMEIHIACGDLLGNENSAATNLDLQYFILQGNYITATDKQFIYICPPVPAPTAALLTQTQRLVADTYVDIDVTQLTACEGIAAVTAGPVSLNAQIPGTVTHNISAGWNLIYNPFGTAVEFDGTHFNFRKSGDATIVSLDQCTDVADYAILGPGNGLTTYVPDDTAAIPAFSAYMVYSLSAGELIMNQ